MRVKTAIFHYHFKQLLSISFASFSCNWEVCNFYNTSSGESQTPTFKKQEHRRKTNSSFKVTNPAKHSSLQVEASMGNKGNYEFMVDCELTKFKYQFCP